MHPMIGGSSDSSPHPERWASDQRGVAKPLQLAAGLGALLGALLGGATAAHAQPVVGYQAGVTQSLSATYGDDLNAINAVIELRNPTGGPTPPGALSPRDFARQQRGWEGLVTDTSANTSLTLDLPGTYLDQALLMSAGVSYIAPHHVPALPPQLPPQTRYTLRDDMVAERLGAAYLGRLRFGPRQISLRLYYDLQANGRLQASPNGGYQGNIANAEPTPSAAAGMHAFRADTHRVGGGLDNYVKRSFLVLHNHVHYEYTRDGVFNLSAGALTDAGRSGHNTNLGAFVQSNVHTVVWAMNLDLRLGTQDSLRLTNIKTWTLPETLSRGTRALAIIPKTRLQRASARWIHNLTTGRTLGLSFELGHNHRRESDLEGRAVPNGKLRRDSFILSPRLHYDNLRNDWKLRVRASVGLSRATLYQPPIGLEPERAAFTPYNGGWEPVVSLGLRRRFAPLELALHAERRVGAGALGASAVVVDAAEFTAQTQLPRRVVLTGGANMVRTRGVADRDFQPQGARDALRAMANNAWTAGAQVGLLVPVVQRQRLHIDLQAGYQYAWVRSDPNHRLGAPPTDNHTAVMALRMLFGRGTAQRAAVDGPERGALLSSLFYVPERAHAPHLLPQNAHLNPDPPPTPDPPAGDRDDGEGDDWDDGDG